MFICTGLYGQHATSIKAELDDSKKSLKIEQSIKYRNVSGDTLNEIYLNDWMNAFSDTRTPLARRFFEEYDRDFHFARQEKRGRTTINSISSNNIPAEVEWSRPPAHPDLIKIIPSSPILPGEEYVLNLDYIIKIPSDEFTRYGFSGKGSYQLKYWYITPGVYNQGWQVYSHKNMNDYFIPKLDLEIELTIPTVLSAISPLKIEKIEPHGSTKTVFLSGKDRVETELHLTRDIIFDNIHTNNLNVLSNLGDEGINPVLKSLMVNRIISFLDQNLGPYPHDKILSTRQDYAANPVYGLNQLPKFIRPFPEGFNYDLQQLKTLTENYLENTLLLNPRKDKWIFDAIQIYLMMEYIDLHYPDLTILGSFSDVIGIRWFHASELKFNDQYPLMYMFMARKHEDQALITPQDSLVKFNKNIANPYKAGVGFKYLDYYLQDPTVSQSIKEFYSEYKLQPVVTSQDFNDILKKNADKDINWFFEEYVGTNEKIDFRIKRVKKEGDSLEVTLKNRTGNSMPVPVFGLNDGEVIYKEWIEKVEGSKTFKIPSEGIETVAVNYEAEIPEINQRNNFKTVNGLLNRPIQFRLLKDIEDPRYNQIFFIPEFQYNLYDGIALGARVYNKALLDRNFEFSIAPLYGFNSQTVVGSAGISHQIFFNDDNLYALRYGISGSRFSYGYGLFYETFTPYLTLSFRNSFMRDSRNERLRIRNVNVYRDESLENPLEIPDYSVFNINYTYSNSSLVEHIGAGLDFQVAQQFSKSSLTLEYRKLLKNDRQLNFRFFGGAFIYNDRPYSDYFSFALDRPTDYLFDYNYYGRSETSGLFSQQIIMAEGGFKSMLEPEYANQWITTVNGSATLWKWIFAYGDVGLVKNKYEPAKFLYDSGIRLSIVQNYFELFFPVYSSNGWEFNDGNYDQKIRFIATLDIKTFINIFTREWF